MAKKRLLLLTSTYPFGELDHFIESELSSLASQFEIDVLPQNFIDRPNPFHKNYLQYFKYVPGLYCCNDRELVWTALKYNSKHPAFLSRLFCQTIFEAIYLFVIESMSVVKTLGRRLLGIPTGRLRIIAKMKSLAQTIGIILVSNYKLKNQNFKDYDLIYSYWSDNLALALMFKLHPQKIVSRFHGYDLYTERKSARYFPFRRFYLRHLTRGFLISDFSKSYLLKKYRIRREERFTVAYIGSLNKNQVTIERTRAVKGRLHILTCSHFNPVKQLPKLIAAIALCDFPIHWDHIGGPIDAGGQEIIDLAEKHITNPHCSFQFHGYFPHEEILTKMVQLAPDVFVNCSQSEGLPVSIMEAMSIGLPIIAPTIGGIPEAVFENKNGFLLETVFAPEDLKLALYKFWQTDQKTREEMAVFSKKIWSEQFNSTKSAEELSQQLFSLAGEPENLNS